MLGAPASSSAQIGCRVSVGASMTTIGAPRSVAAQVGDRRRIGLLEIQARDVSQDRAARREAVAERVREPFDALPALLRGMSPGSFTWRRVSVSTL